VFQPEVLLSERVWESTFQRSSDVTLQLHGCWLCIQHVWPVRLWQLTLHLRGAQESCGRIHHQQGDCLAVCGLPKWSASHCYLQSWAFSVHGLMGTNTVDVVVTDVDSSSKAVLTAVGVSRLLVAALRLAGRLQITSLVPRSVRVMRLCCLPGCLQVALSSAVNLKHIINQQQVMNLIGWLPMGTGRCQAQQVQRQKFCRCCSSWQV
jgi:hypothetical protein